MGNMRDLNEFVSADHSSLAEMRGRVPRGTRNVYGSEFTDALESGYDLNAESHDCASGSAVLETCDTTRAEQPMNHVKGCDRHEPLSLEPDLHPFADSYPKQPKHTIVLKSDTVYTPRGTTRSAQTERMKNMPKKTPEPEQAPKADNYAKINMPAAFLTPHDIQTSDGRTFEKCFVSFPRGRR